MRCRSGCLNRIAVAMLVATVSVRAAEEAISVEKAWEVLPQYEYGQDMAPLLAIDREVIRAMDSPAARADCAARLARLLEAPTATRAARQYVCLQLRQVGTPDQVPALARLLSDSELSEDARLALEAIPGEQSLAALRAALQSVQGRALIGVIQSLAARRDAEAVDGLRQLAESDDVAVARAALWALGNIANAEATTYLLAQAQKAAIPTPRELAVPLLRCAEAEAAGSTDRFRSVIYTYLGQAGQEVGVRRAALDGMLQLAENRQAGIQKWFASDDADLRSIAAGHLSELSDEALDDLTERLAELPESSQFALLEVMAPRKGSGLLPLALSLAQSDRPELQAAGIRCLGMLGDDSVLPLLLNALASGGMVTEAAQQALTRLPRKAVVAALLEALAGQPAIRVPVIEALTKLKCYEAIDPLIQLASSADPLVYEPALTGLRSIADPDEHDVPRLVGLLMRTPAGRQRDAIERTITIVCEKLPPGRDRGEPVLAAVRRLSSAEVTQYLPLLGRLGGPRARQIIESAMGSDDPPVRQAAVRALCNWPTVEVAEELWELATQPGPAPQRQAALRAYVRVVTLPSDRPENQTFAMLRKSMELAQSVEDRRWIISRAASVRTMETVAWLAPFLDDGELDQDACLALVELAHHRFLRQPHMDRFGPLLEKVSQVSRDPNVKERAQKYRLGL